MIPKCPFYINGQFIEGAEKQNIINPSTGKVIAEVSMASLKDVELAISSAREAFDQGPWPQFSLAERKTFIRKIAQGILDNAGQLAELETQNTGKPIKETTFMDIPSGAETFDFIAHNFIDYLEGQQISVPNAKAELLREPG